MTFTTVAQQCIRVFRQRVEERFTVLLVLCVLYIVLYCKSTAKAMDDLMDCN